MDTKICKTCGAEKELSSFQRRKKIDGSYYYNLECKECHKAYTKQYSVDNKERLNENSRQHYIKNKEKIDKRQKQYAIENKEKISIRQKQYRIKNDAALKQYRIEHKETKTEYDKNYRSENKIIISQRKKEYRQKNIEHIIKKLKEYYQDNKELVRQNNREYYINNKDTIIKNHNQYKKNKRKTDHIYKLRDYVSNMIYRSLRGVGSSKCSKSCVEYLSFSMIEFKHHIEKLFCHSNNLTSDGKVWMSWNNRGVYNMKIWDDNDPSTWAWQIDHIIPQADLPYTSMEDDNFKKCWALENLRPYSAKLNVIDGAKRIRHNKGNK